MNRITEHTPPANGLIRAAIDRAKADPADDEVSLAMAIALLRRRQLARGDVQRKLAEIWEKRGFRGGRP